MKGTGNWAGGLWKWSGLGVFVRSNVTVGNGADAEMVAMFEEHGSTVRARKLAFMRPPSVLDMDPESSMEAAAAVVEAMATAAGGKGWLWLPS